jgi:hypothetical protein
LIASLIAPHHPNGLETVAPSPLRDLYILCCSASAFLSSISLLVLMQQQGIVSFYVVGGNMRENQVGGNYLNFE